MSENNPTLTDRQREILEYLMEKPFLQNELQDKLSISSPSLIYHLKKLEKKMLIIKKTIQQIGSVRINEISINPYKIQQIRYLLGLKIKHNSLITGYGEYGEGYRIPDVSYGLIKKKYFIIDRIICFTTPEAKKKRDENQVKYNLIDIDQHHTYEYSNYRNLDSIVFDQLDKIIHKEIQESDLIIDITPLSKLFSIILLKKANQYGLPCFYIGHDDKGNNKIIWLSEIKIEGKMK